MNMGSKKHDIKARIDESDFISLMYLKETMGVSRSDVVRMAIEKLLNDKVWIEEFTFCDIGYDFKKFEGIKTMESAKYNFLVLFWNDNDFRNRGNIAYKIYIPYEFFNKDKEFKKYLVNKVVIRSYEDIEKLSYDKTDGQYVLDFLSGIRNDIEQEIFDYLESENLTEKFL